MKSCYTGLLMVLCIAASPPIRAQGETNAHVKITPVGFLSVAAGFGNESPRPFNCDSQLKMALLVESNDRSIVDISAKECALTLLRDNRGTTLQPRLNPPFTLCPGQSSPDGRRFIVEIDATPPAHGATDISAAGRITFVVGKTARTYAAKNISLVKGKIPVEGVKASITDVGKTDWCAAGTRLSLRIDGLASWRLERIAFVDRDGQVIPAKFSGVGLVHYPLSGNYEVSYRTMGYVLPPETTTATIHFSIWEETELLEVPFAFTTGLGL